jgi:hypothetical protein
MTQVEQFFLVPWARMVVSVASIDTRKVAHTVHLQDPIHANDT